MWYVVGRGALSGREEQTALNENPWDREYRQKGIPSSFRDEPSGALVWGLEAWRHVREAVGAPATALDVGCGTARNSLYLASAGVLVQGLDGSREALARASERLALAPREVAERVRLQHGLIEDGLPAASGSVELALDLFVSKHLIDDAARAAYRAELRRVLSPGGLYLLSLAGRGDGYYSQCPSIGAGKVVDPKTGVGSVLYDLAGLQAELSDGFGLHMAWIKKKRGVMHGRELWRETLVTVWGLA